MDRIEQTSRPYFWLKVSAVYLKMNMKTQSAECLSKAREAILKSEDLISAADDVRELAEGYLNLGDRTKALDLVEKGQTIIKDLPEDIDRILRLLESAGLYFRLGEEAKALGVAEQVYRLISGWPIIRLSSITWAGWQ